ncbi:glutathione S-transferase [Peziza echinospora]|nr:glutathione S-transferase [Peziza echinospora]
MSTKKFTLFASQGPNPWKVLYVLHELGFADDVEIKLVGFSGPGSHKDAAFTKYNPNGRTPAFVDHSNNDFVIWESGAILYYLVEKYDTEHKISFSTVEEKSLAIQYLAFQISGQGPYFGQAVWFHNYHAEDIPTAKKRYLDEIHRVLSVLETILEGKEWLVSNKFSYADISFVPWNKALDWFASKAPEVATWREKYPNVGRWHEAVLARPATKAAEAVREALFAPPPQ